MSLERGYLKLVLFCLPLLLVVTSCKKKRAFKQENGQAAEDVRRVQQQNDEIVQDINIAIMEQPLLRGGSPSQEAVTTRLCGVTVDSNSIYSGILRLTYDGTLCNGIRRKGVIIATLVEYPLKKWKNSECNLKIQFLAYKVTRSDGQSIQFDGVEYLSNKSGNTWYEMHYLNASNLVQIHSANNLKITLDGEHTAIFNLNRQMTFNFSVKDSVTSCKLEGMGSSNGLYNLDNWGQNRDGNNFTTQVITPLFWKSSCGNDSPVEGEMQVEVEGKDFEMNCKFGVNESGESYSGGDSCPYGWQVNWSYKKKTSTRVFAYN